MFNTNIQDSYATAIIHILYLHYNQKTILLNKTCFHHLISIFQ